MRTMRPRLLSRDFALLLATGLALGLSFQLPLTVTPLYALQLGGDEADVGLVIGVFALAAMVARPLTGWQLDRGRRTAVLMLGAATFALCSAGYAAVGSLALLLGLRAVHGTGMSNYQTATQTLVGDLAPPERRGEAMGLQGSMMIVAAGVGPPLGAAIASRLGFEPLFLIAGAIAAVGLGFASFVREPARLGPPARPRLFHRDAVGPGLILLGPMFTFGAMASFVPVYAVRHGLDNPGLFFTVYAGATILAQNVGGRLSDRLGRSAAILPGLLLGAVGIFLVPQLEGLALLIAAAVYGLGQGLSQPALFALPVDLVPPAERGSALATAGLFLELGIGSGAIGAGLLAKGFGLETALVLAAAAPLVSAAASLRLLGLPGRFGSARPSAGDSRSVG